MAQLEIDARPARLPGWLRRHQLVRLSPAGWSAVLEAPWDEGARACLGWWSACGLPLVVTRQPVALPDTVAVGLPAPARFRRRRIALAVAPGDVMFIDEFPLAGAVARQRPRAQATAWRALADALGAFGCGARVYGGYGWQALTGLTYVHAGSDLDLLLPVNSAPHADAVVGLLAAAAWSGPRLDGELLFPDGAAVAWREWAAHREGRAAQVLVKRLHGVALERPSEGLA